MCISDGKGFTKLLVMHNPICLRCSVSIGRKVNNKIES